MTEGVSSEEGGGDVGEAGVVVGVSGGGGEDFTCCGREEGWDLIVGGRGVCWVILVVVVEVVVVVCVGLTLEGGDDDFNC